MRQLSFPKEIYFAMSDIGSLLVLSRGFERKLAYMLNTVSYDEFDPHFVNRLCVNRFRTIRFSTLVPSPGPMSLPHAR